MPIAPASYTTPGSSSPGEFVARLDQLAHEVGRAHEGDAVAAAYGLHTERDREVRLAGADRPGDDDVLGALDVRAGRKLGELRPLDAPQPALSLRRGPTRGASLAVGHENLIRRIREARR